jgi:hypothetical protein
VSDVENQVKTVDYVQDYQVTGASFTVAVQRAKELDKYATEYWRYAILVKGHVIESSTYAWDWQRQGRHITNRGAANHLASFWGHSDIVKDAQELQGTFEYELDKIVEKCAAWMHGYFIAEDQEHTDYDIVNQFMDEDEWIVVLRPNYMPNRLMEFYKTIEMDSVEIHSYIEDNELSVKL